MASSVDDVNHSSPSCLRGNSSISHDHTMVFAREPYGSLFRNHPQIATLHATSNMRERRSGSITTSHLRNGVPYFGFAPLSLSGFFDLTGREFHSWLWNESSVLNRSLSFNTCSTRKLNIAEQFRNHPKYYRTVRGWTSFDGLLFLFRLSRDVDKISRRDLLPSLLIRLSLSF
jgi:hypothetical protein